MSRFLLLLAGMAATTFVQADVVYMKNGDRITGDITEVWDDSLVIEPSYSDEFSIDLEEVESFKTEAPIDLELEDGSNGEFEVARSSNPGEIIIKEDGQSRSLTLRELRRLSEIEEYFEWDANLNLNQTISQGTNDSSTGNINGELNLKWGNHRTLYTLTNIREIVDDETTRNNSRLNASYNYLFDNNWFFAANITYEQDPISLLEGRVTANPGIGYDIFDDPDLVLNVQLGTGYQREDFDNTIEKSAVVDWRLRYNQEFLNGDLDLFHNQQIQRSFQGRENTTLNIQTGIRYDISDDIFLNAQLNYDLDSAPAENTASEQFTFVFGAGIDF